MFTEPTSGRCMSLWLNLNHEDVTDVWKTSSRRLSTSHAEPAFSKAYCFMMLPPTLPVPLASSIGTRGLWRGGVLVLRQLYWAVPFLLLLFQLMEDSYEDCSWHISRAFAMLLVEVAVFIVFFCWSHVSETLETMTRSYQVPSGQKLRANNSTKRTYSWTETWMNITLKRSSF